MKVKIIKLTNQALMQRACEMTLHGETSAATLETIYRSEHSPVRTQWFWIELIGIPSFVSVHFVRHKLGVDHFVTSNREDRGGDSGADRWSPVNHGLIVNAQELIFMSRKRLCNKAHEETSKVMLEIRKAMLGIDYDLSERLLPECVYRNGYCPEVKPCGGLHLKMALYGEIMKDVNRNYWMTEAWT